MGFLKSFLTQKADLYTIDVSTSSATGQPVENLVLQKTIRVFFTPHPSVVYNYFASGGIKIGDFTAITEDTVLTNQVVSINNIKYRVVSAVPVPYKTKNFGYVLYLEYYHH